MGRPTRAFFCKSNVRRLFSIPTFASTAHTNFVEPLPKEIKRLQSEAGNIRPNSIVFDNTDDLWKSLAGACLVLDGACDLQFHVTAHTSAPGNRGHKATSMAWKQLFFWCPMSTDVKLFILSCLHCLSTTCESKVPCTLGSAINCVKLDDLLRFNCLKLGPGSTALK